MDIECIVTSSTCLFFTILSVVAHFGLGVYYFCVTGTFPLKEKINTKVVELRSQRRQRHDTAESDQFSD